MGRRKYARKTGIIVNLQSVISAELQPSDPPDVRNTLAAPARKRYRIRMNFVLRPWQLFFLILSGWVIHAYLDHYHGERNHQGLGNQIIGPGGEVGQEIGEVQCRERLGGMLRYYYRDAA